MSSTKDLFGGAIKVTLPNIYIDASTLRQIPDTQEVFLHPTSGVSLIVEVLESVDQQDIKKAAEFHFDSLAHDNSAVKHDVGQVVTTSERRRETPAPVLLRGTQLVPKFNKTVPDEVQILLALYRIPNKNVDLVMTMNVPTRTVEGDAVSGDELAAATREFDIAALSLTIVDFGLFA